MKKYRCTACGYVYDPAEGDPEGGIPHGVPFEDLPDDWICPVWGFGKRLFVALEDSASARSPSCGVPLPGRRRAAAPEP